MTTKRIYIDFCTGEELKEKREITKTKVGDMTVAEMEARLEAGYEPIDVSIENWMRKDFDEHHRDNDGDTCSLCHVHYYNGGCHDCPLNMIGECCYTPDSAYQTAFKARNPQIMLDALYKARAYVDEQKCKELKLKKQKNNEKHTFAVWRSGVRRSLNTTYFRLECSSGEIVLVAVNEKGDRVKQGNILFIDKEGCVVTCGGLTDTIGLQLDPESEYIKIKET